MGSYIIVRKFGRKFYALDVWGNWTIYTKADVIRFACSGAALRVLMRIGDDNACVHRID